MLAAAMVGLLSASQPADPAPPILQACLGQSRYAADLKQLGAIRSTLSDAEWRDACRQAREANQRRLSATKMLLRTGKSPVGGYERALLEVEKARSAKDPVLAELFIRTARDAAARSSLSRLEGAKTYARGLTPSALALLDALVAADAVAVDADNREWLKRTIGERGWFTLSRDGPEADRAAWLIVQHSDMDRAFQRTVLEVLEPLAAAGETSKRGYAFLYDRWADGAGEPQRFGLAGRCVGPGAWEPKAIADPGKLDARRLDAGLGTMAEFRAQMSKTCR